MKGDTFNKYFLKQKQALFAYVLGFVKNRHVAEDLLQDLYVKLWHKRLYMREDALKYYFFQSARNICIDHKRQQKNEVEVSFSLEYDNNSDSLENKELSEIFRNIVAELPENYREVVYLKDICDMGSEEAAKVCGLSTNNLRVTLSRARAKVKEQLKEIYSYENIR